MADDNYQVMAGHDAHLVTQAAPIQYAYVQDSIQAKKDTEWC